MKLIELTPTTRRDLDRVMEKLREMKKTNHSARRQTMNLLAPKTQVEAVPLSLKILNEKYERTTPHDHMACFQTRRNCYF